MIDEQSQRLKFAADMRAFAANELSFENFVIKYRNIDAEVHSLDEKIQDFFLFHFLDDDEKLFVTPKDDYEDIGDMSDIIEIVLANKKAGRENYFKDFEFFRTDIQYMNRLLLFLECQTEEESKAFFKKNDLLWRNLKIFLLFYPLLLWPCYKFFDDFQIATVITGLPLSIIFITFYYLNNYYSPDSNDLIPFRSFSDLSQTRRANPNFKRIPLINEIIDIKISKLSKIFEIIRIYTLCCLISVLMPYFYIIVVIICSVDASKFFMERRKEKCKS